MRAAAFGEAVVIFDDESAHRYRVDNLSSGGALLTGSTPLPLFEVVRVLLRVGGMPARMIKARTAWQTCDGVNSYGVTFLHLDADTEDSIHDVVLDILAGTAAPGPPLADDAALSWLP
jgi:hypothetical protein